MVGIFNMEYTYVQHSVYISKILQKLRRTVIITAILDDCTLLILLSQHSTMRILFISCVLILFLKQLLRLQQSQGHLVQYRIRIYNDF